MRTYHKYIKIIHFLKTETLGEFDFQPKNPCSELCFFSFSLSFMFYDQTVSSSLYWFRFQITVRQAGLSMFDKKERKISQGKFSKSCCRRILIILWRRLSALISFPLCFAAMSAAGKKTSGISCFVRTPPFQTFSRRAI